MVNRNTPDSHRIVIDFNIDLSTPEGLTKFKLLLDEFCVFDEGQNREVFVKILNSIDPNNEYGLHAICELYLTDQYNDFFPNDVALRLLNFYANQLDLSKLDILQDQKYVIDLIRSGLLSVHSVNTQFIGAIYRINAADIKAIGEKKSRSNSRTHANGYEQIFHFLETIDVFELNPKLLSEMIDIYSNVQEWENYYEGEFLVVLKQTLKNHPELLEHIKQSLEVLVQRTIDITDCSKTYLLITSGLFDNDPVLFGRLYYSLEGKALLEAVVNEHVETEYSAIDWLSNVISYLEHRDMEKPAPSPIYFALGDS